MADRDGSGRAGRRRTATDAGGPAYAALDLGTNNCRLLVARRASRGFQVIDSLSRIVRLGEGLSASGRLGEAAMDRALAALRECAEKLAPHQDLILRAIATQACRVAANGEAFLARVRCETGIALEIVSPGEEARLSVLGCAALFDPAASCVLVIDIGGGSTELSWVEVSRGSASPKSLAWTSLPLGVVTLAERLPEDGAPDWYDRLRETVAAEVRAFTGADDLKPVFETGAGHIVGTSGAVSSLAGVHLDLRRYARSRVDGLWMTREEVGAAARKLRDMPPAARAAHPCIGPDRADLVAPGAAILEAVCAAWPSPRVRVADRGLREGVLLELLSGRSAPR